jgi:hypothetical protein
MAAREQLKYQEALTKQTMSVTNSGTMARMRSGFSTVLPCVWAARE